MIFPIAIRLFTTRAHGATSYHAVAEFTGLFGPHSIVQGDGTALTSAADAAAAAVRILVAANPDLFPVEVKS
jgi:hypothetical protein